MNTQTSSLVSDPELRWILLMSARVALVLSVLEEGGWLERHEEQRYPKRPDSKVMKGVTRLYDKDGNKLSGVHNYARFRLERINRLVCIQSNKRTIWTLRNRTPGAPF